MKHLLRIALAATLLSSSIGFAQSQAQWPTIEQQLTRDDVTPGSALDQLIRQNQDFSLLRPEELTTHRPRLPPWLKVLWRKNHPKGTYQSDDPSGGYPLVLNEIHEWMLSHQDLKSGQPEPSKLPGESPKSGSVSGELRISGLQSAPRSESDIRVNYWDTQKIISGSNNISGSGGQSQFYSLDGGATWGQTSLPIDTAGGDAFHSDPTVDWTSDGTAWSTTLGIDAGVTVLRLRSYKSTDNGATWLLEATPSAGQTSVDKQMVWVDHSATSACKDFQYAIWHNGAPAFMSTRNATTNIWSAPVQVSGAESTGTAIGSDVKANSFGDAFGFWPTTTNRRIFVTKSTNCGGAWGTPVQIGTTFDGFDIGVPSFNNRRALIYVSGGAYRNVDKNLVYAAWTDLSGDVGCTAAANEPGSNVASICKTRIWFSRSTDGGATWAAATKINNQAGLNDQFNQWLVVDESTGAVGVIYYDTVDDVGRKKVDLFWQASFDDGVTWQAPLKVTSAQTDETAGGQDSGNQFGDYNGLSGIAGQFFPSWTDRRGGLKEEIWTAKITDVACTVPGSPDAPVATATGPNQVQITWNNGAPASTTFNVSRANGTCAAPGTFASVATGVASPFTDTTVSGGSTYAYLITGKDSTGNCTSAPSLCVEATATGTCTLAPTFAGATSATNDAAETCGTQVNWSAATPQCAGPTSYDVFRATTPGFVPNAGNRIATAVVGTNYADSAGLTTSIPHYYVVRSVDGSNSASDTNTVERSVVPTGPISTANIVETFEGALSGGGFDTNGWTHQSLSGVGAAAVDWAWSTVQPQSPTHSWFSDSQTTVSERVITTPSFGVIASTTLSFWHTYAFESATSCFDAGTLEVSTDGGTVWTVVPDAAFTAGGFTGTVSSSFSNPLGGKRAWCNGTIGAMTQVNVNLGAYAGQNVKIRWHEGDDSSAQATGWYIDSVTITDAGTAAACSAVVIDDVFEDGFEETN